VVELDASVIATAAGEYAQSMARVALGGLLDFRSVWTEIIANFFSAERLL
jgi:hypothetical protein